MVDLQLQTGKEVPLVRVGLRQHQQRRENSTLQVVANLVCRSQLVLLNQGRMHWSHSASELRL